MQRLFSAQINHLFVWQKRSYLSSNPDNWQEDVLAQVLFAPIFILFAEHLSPMLDMLVGGERGYKYVKWAAISAFDKSGQLPANSSLPQATKKKRIILIESSVSMNFSSIF